MPPSDGSVLSRLSRSAPSYERAHSGRLQRIAHLSGFIAAGLQGSPGLRCGGDCREASNSLMSVNLAVWKRAHPAAPVNVAGSYLWAWTAVGAALELLLQIIPVALGLKTTIDAGPYADRVARAAGLRGPARSGRRHNLG